MGCTVVAHAEKLRMPLYGDERPVVVLVVDRFNRSIDRRCHHLKAITQFLDRLMVDRVDAVETGADDARKSTTLLDFRMQMRLVYAFSRDVVPVDAGVRRQVLHE